MLTYLPRLYQLGALPVIRPGAVTQKVNVAAASTASAQPLGSGVVRLVATVDCYVAFGDAPAANTTTSIFLPASTPEYFACMESDKVAVIRSQSDGSLFVTPAV